MNDTVYEKKMYLKSVNNFKSPERSVLVYTCIVVLMATQGTLHHFSCKSKHSMDLILYLNLLVVTQTEPPVEPQSRCFNSLNVLEVGSSLFTEIIFGMI